MFRASLRSVSDPLREYVCFSCLAQSFGARPQLRLFYYTPLLRAEAWGGDTGSSRSIEKTVESIKKSLPPRGRKHQPSDKDGKHAKSHDQDGGDRDAPTTAKKKAGRKTTRKARIEVVKQSRKGQKKSKKLKSQESDAKSEEPSPDSTTRIQSSVQSIIAKLKKPPPPNPKDGPQTPKFLSGSVSSRETGNLDSGGLAITALDIERPPVPELSFGLQRVLFNPGVYHLRDPRSRVFNFDPYLGSIMPVTEFDFAALKEYITSSKDDTLRNIAMQEQKKYIGSSSSMTSVLSHFHYLLSAWRAIDTQTMSQGFPDKLRTFTRLLRAPSAMFLRYQDGVYAIDADKEFDSANILMNLGKSMEKLLTLPKEDFERYRRSSENKISAEEEQAVPEAYHYSTIGDFIMRSQLDAYDPRLPGTGMFDLKTRAVVSIRMDARNFEQGLGYQIKSRFGMYESYEREFFDMIRAAFLKYSLQVRVGRMDGIFVAFHNIERIFGFQYVSLPEMDQTLHGQTDTSLGDAEFRLSLMLWNKILNKATAKFPKKSLRFHFETRDTEVPFMYIFAEPVTEDEIHSIQTKNQAEIEAYQRRILDLSPHESEGNYNPPTIATVNEPSSQTNIIPNQLEAKADQVSQEGPQESNSNTSSSSDKNHRELLSMVLVVKNIVNGTVVERPMNLKPTDTWKIEYELSELNSSKSQALYEACQKRREKALTGRGEDETDVAANVYIRRLREVSKQGRVYHEEQERLDKEQGVIVLDDSKV